jgi:DNA helicase-2/ATP-dependent DNA helicase PcrA
VRERWESLAALAALGDELAEELDNSLPAFVAELDARAEVQHAPVADGVTLSSIHSAKGLEWPVVFVVGCSDGLLPLQHAETADQIEEERRLAYVAITRAADRLHLSWARSRQPGGRAVRRLSPFLVGLDGVVGAEAPAEPGQVRRGSGRVRGERRQKGPATCRICRKALVTGRERTLGRCASCPVDLDEDLLAELKSWRLEESRERSVPAYVVCTDATLIAIAEQRPESLEALAEIPGIGPAKLEAYGDAILFRVRAG